MNFISEVDFASQIKDALLCYFKKLRLFAIVCLPQVLRMYKVTKKFQDHFERTLEY